jgi:hypothetical protein
MKKKYFKNIETGHIYKEAGDKFGYQYLKVTPWETGEDRRTNINELKKLELEGKVVKIPFAKAREELNTIWNNTDRFWVHDNKECRVLSNVNLLEYRTMPPGHSWERKWKDMQGNEHTDTWTWYLVMFQGKLYWTLRTQYYPQQEIVHFKGFDIEPDFEHGGQWTNAKNLHPVYVKNENNEWEMV